LCFHIQVWRLQAALGEQTEITKITQQEYERLQHVRFSYMSVEVFTMFVEVFTMFVILMHILFSVGLGKVSGFPSRVCLYLTGFQNYSLLISKSVGNSTWMNMQPIYPLLSSFSKLSEFFLSPSAHHDFVPSVLSILVFFSLQSVQRKRVPSIVWPSGRKPGFDRRELVRAHEKHDGGLPPSLRYAFPF